MKSYEVIHNDKENVCFLGSHDLESVCLNNEDDAYRDNILDPAL